jgi:hypothetical protein
MPEFTVSMRGPSHSLAAPFLILEEVIHSGIQLLGKDRAHVVSLALSLYRSNFCGGSSDTGCVQLYLGDWRLYHRGVIRLHRHRGVIQLHRHQRTYVHGDDRSHWMCRASARSIHRYFDTGLYQL